MNESVEILSRHLGSMRTVAVNGIVVQVRVVGVDAARRLLGVVDSSSGRAWWIEANQLDPEHGELAGQLTAHSHGN